MNRRRFLKQSATAAAAVVLGVPAVTLAKSLRYRGRGPLAQGGDPMPEAITQAKSENKLILAVLLPADQLSATQIVSRFPELLASGDKPTRRIFCEAIFATIPAQAAATRFPKHKADGRILCLDSSGEPLEERDSPTDLSAQQFAPAMALLLHGKDGARLAKQVDLQTKALDETGRKKLDGLLKDLGSEEFKTRENASKELLALAPQCTALLAQAHAAARDPEVKQRITVIFDRVFESGEADKSGPRRIHGVVVGAFQNNYPAVDCGMATTWPLSRTFLAMLSTQSQDDTMGRPAHFSFPQ